MGRALPALTPLSRASGAVAAPLGPVSTQARAREVEHVVNQWQPWSPRTRSPGPGPGRRLDGKLPAAIWKTLDIFQASGRRRKQGEQSPESQPASSAVLPGPRPLVWTSGSEWSRGEGSAFTTWMVRAPSEAPAHASLGCTVTNFTLGQDSQPQRYRHWRQCRLVGGMSSWAVRVGCLTASLASSLQVTVAFLPTW